MDISVLKLSYHHVRANVKKTWGRRQSDTDVKILYVYVWLSVIYTVSPLWLTIDLIRHRVSPFSHRSEPKVLGFDVRFCHSVSTVFLKIYDPRHRNWELRIENIRLQTIVMNWTYGFHPGLYMSVIRKSGNCLRKELMNFLMINSVHQFLYISLVSYGILFNRFHNKCLLVILLRLFLLYDWFMWFVNKDVFMVLMWRSKKLVYFFHLETRQKFLICLILKSGHSVQ